LDWCRLPTLVISTGRTAADAEQPLRRVHAVEAIAGRGLKDDRYYHGRGTFSGPGRGYELTLVEADALEGDRDRSQRPLGQGFKIGEAVCVGRRLAEPCAHLEKLSGPGLLRPLVHRAGLRVDILEGGTITVGDRIEAAPSQ
jgi:hypothetical protein